MIGAILGDMIGSPYEFDQGKKTKDFPLFPPQATYTDDTVMTLAVAQAFLDTTPGMSDGAIRELLSRRMRVFGKAFPYAGYGGRFRLWLEDPGMGPYGSQCHLPGPNRRIQTGDNVLHPGAVRLSPAAHLR